MKVKAQQLDMDPPLLVLICFILASTVAFAAVRRFIIEDSSERAVTLRQKLFYRLWRIDPQEADTLKGTPALILVALLFTMIASAGLPHERQVVQASEILAKIERGEPVSIDNLIVEGDLNLSEFGLDAAPKLGAGFGSGQGPKPTIEIGRPLAEGVKIIASPISITNSLIQGNVNFEKITFGSSVNFAGTDIAGNASFAEAKFENHAAFLYTSFRGNVSFKAAKFNGRAYFSGDQFGERADFEGTQFGNFAGFSYAKFGDDADFKGAKFRDEAYFGGAQFSDDADFGGTEFGGYAYFGRVQFSGRSHLQEARFTDMVNFYSARLADRA